MDLTTASPYNPMCWIVASLVFLFTVAARCGLPPLKLYEVWFRLVGLDSVSRFIRVVEMGLSLSRGRQESELTEFTRRFSVLHRRFQRYQYFAETFSELQRKPPHSLSGRQKCLLTKATKELESLPWQVYEAAQSLENYREAKPDNIWIRDWLATYQQRHESSARSACARRLGCCATTCGCCDRRRKIPGGAAFGPDGRPGGRFMCIVGEGWVGNRAHCSIDCGCCIRRRGFRVAAESEGNLVKEGEAEEDVTLPGEEIKTESGVS